MIRLYVIGGLILALASAAGLQSWRLHRAQLALAALRADAAQAQAAAEAVAREREQQYADRIEQIAADYQRSLGAVSRTSRLVIDDLRAGNVRLREQWRGCQADRLPAVAASTGGADAAEQGRRDSAARIVRAADACDAQVTALQALVRADRAAVEGTP